MSVVDKAVETQLSNIQKKTGMTLGQLDELVRKSGLGKHGEILKMLKSELGIGHGDANLVARLCLRTDKKAAGFSGEPEAPAGGDVLDEIYSGPKALLRPIHEAVMAKIGQFGEFEVAPKKGYVSLRRKKQFAMVGVATKGRVEVGLNMKGADASDRLIAMPPGGMCQYKVFLSGIDEVDEQLIGWVRQAYDAAG